MVCNEEEAKVADWRCLQEALIKLAGAKASKPPLLGGGPSKGDDLEEKQVGAGMDWEGVLSAVIAAAAPTRKLLFHEKQIRALCGNHALNNLMQGGM